VLRPVRPAHGSADDSEDDGSIREWTRIAAQTAAGGHVPSGMPSTMPLTNIELQVMQLQHPLQPQEGEPLSPLHSPPDSPSPSAAASRHSPPSSVDAFLPHPLHPRRFERVRPEPPSLRLPDLATPRRGRRCAAGPILAFSLPRRAKANVKRRLFSFSRISRISRR